MMKSPNLGAIRAELPRGSISAIAEKVGIDPKKVTEYFHNGWHQQYSGAILTEAMEIIKAKYPDEDVLQEFDDLGLAGGYSRVLPRRKKHISQLREKSGTIGWLLAAAGVAITAYFVVPEVRQFIDDNLLGKKKKLTPEEEVAAAVKAGAEAGGTAKK